MPFDLSDVVLNGTQNYKEYLDEVINRFQIRFNKTKVYEDALIECINDYFCKQNTGID